MSAASATSEAPFKSLRTYNALMGLLHLVQGVLMFAHQQQLCPADHHRLSHLQA